MSGDSTRTDRPAPANPTQPRDPGPNTASIDSPPAESSVVRLGSPLGPIDTAAAARLRTEVRRAESAVAAAEARLARERRVAAQAEQLARLEAHRQHLLARREAFHTLLADVDRTATVDFRPLNAIVRALIAGARARASIDAGADIPVGVARRRLQQAAEALHFATARLRTLTSAHYPIGPGEPAQTADSGDE